MGDIREIKGFLIFIHVLQETLSYGVVMQPLEKDGYICVFVAC